MNDRAFGCYNLLMRTRWRAILLWVVVLTLGAPGLAVADVYQCSGPDGEMHFTNVRRRGQRCRLMVRTARARRPPPKHRSSERTPRSASPFEAYIQEAARLYKLPAPFLRAVARIESGFDPQVVSHAGAMGLMQLMPRTAAAMGVRNPFDPRQNVLGGARFLRILANKFNGDLVLTVAAYNAGDGAVERHEGVPPYPETRRYVRRVLQQYYAYSRQ